MFRLHSIKQHSESITILICWVFSSIIPLLFPGLLLSEPVSPTVAAVPGSHLWSRQQKAACALRATGSQFAPVVYLCLWCRPSCFAYRASSRTCFCQEVLMLPCTVSPVILRREVLFTRAATHFSSLLYPLSNPLWSNWGYACVLRKLNYCTAKGHLCPESLAWTMKLFYYPFW